MRSCIIRSFLQAGNGANQTLRGVLAGCGLQATNARISLLVCLG